MKQDNTLYWILNLYGTNVLTSLIKSEHFNKSPLSHFIFTNAKIPAANNLLKWTIAKNFTPLGHFFLRKDFLPTHFLAQLKSVTNLFFYGTEIRHPGGWGWGSNERRPETEDRNRPGNCPQPQDTPAGRSNVGSGHGERVRCTSSSGKSGGR